MMTIADVFETSRHRTNIAHFTAIVNLAIVDGKINREEEKMLKQLAKKLDISKEEYKYIRENPAEFPLIALNSCEERLEHIYDLFRLIYVDHEIDERERKLVLKYAIGLGVPIEEADHVIERSIKIFGGKLNFEDYKYLMNK